MLPARPGPAVSHRRFRWLTRKSGAPGKSFRAKRLHNIDARGACRGQHRSDYRRAKQHERRNDHGQCAGHF
jgi:hypothetical protein